MLRLRADRLSFAFSDAAPIVDVATFVLEPGLTGLVGENGAGKSTLLRLLTGELAPNAGRVRVEPAGARCVLCAQEITAVTPDIAAFAQSASRTVRRLRGALGLGNLPDFRCASAGERKRWQIAAVLAAEPDVLLLDEPTNHLDASGRRWLHAALSRFAGIGVIVSHDRALLQALTTRTLRLHKGGARLYEGAYDRARAQWADERELQLSQRRTHKAEIERVSRSLHAARQAQRGAATQRSARKRMKSRHDADARSMGAQTRADWADARHGRDVAVLGRELQASRAALESVELEKELGGSVFARFADTRAPFVAFRERGPVFAGDRLLLHAPALWLRSRDRVWLRGDNGAGKSTLLAALLANLRVPRREVLALRQELSEREVQADLAELLGLAPDERGQVLSIVAALGVEPARLLASHRPSPGESRKLRIAFGLGRHARALVLDEPENHLDLPSIERLEGALQAYPGALLLITHDATLAAGCTQTQWVIEGGNVTLGSQAG